MRRFIAVVCLTLASTAVFAQDRVGDRDPQERYQRFLNQQRPSIEVHTHECGFKATNCNTTINEEVDIFGCRTDDGHYVNFHRVFINANTRLTLSLKANNFAPLLAVFDDAATTTIGSSSAPFAGTANLTVDITTGGFYVIAVGPIGAGDTGTYTLSVTCGSIPTSGTCSSSDTVMCLNENRFAVSVTWKDFSNNTGVGHAVKLTQDSGYFWFFGANNVELMLKVLGPVDGTKYWVFFGALSTVEYTVTVRDTQTGRVKTYFNPSGQLRSVADTGAF